MTGRRPDVALVYPPFGPSTLPSLGLALLSGRIKQSGFPCTTHYWNLDLIDHIPDPDPERRVLLYDALTQRGWHPYNEWIFNEVLYGRSSPFVEQEELGLLRLGLNCPEPADAALVLALRGRAGELVDEFAARLALHDVVGISTTFYQNIPALALARRVKERWPNKRIILGGANTDGPMGAALLRNFPFVDFVFSGETDTALVELLHGIDDPECYPRIAGLHFRRHGAPTHGPLQPPESRMDELPVPDFDDYVAAWRKAGLHRWRDLVLNMETSRGCWWGAKSHCTFCGLNALGMTYRAKSPAVVQHQIAELRDRHDPRFLFMTDNIMARKADGDVLNWLRDNGDALDLFYEVKSNLGREQVRRLAEARVTSVQPGIESFSTTVLKLMRKGVTAAQNVAFLRYVREYGISPSYNIIIGFPGEAAADYAAMLAQLPLLVHLPAPTSIPFVEYHRFSPYHDRADEFGLKLVANPGYRVLFPYAQDELDDIAYAFVETGASVDRSDLPYFEPLKQAIIAWGGAHDGERPQLSWRDEDGRILVEDRRFGGEARRFLLLGCAVPVFHLLDRPQSVASLHREIARAVAPEPQVAFALTEFITGYAEGAATPVFFDRATFLAEPLECLSLLLEAQLLFVDDNAGEEPLFVALPIRHDSVPTCTNWRRAHV